jgi:hypothetical protein
MVDGITRKRGSRRVTLGDRRETIAYGRIQDEGGPKKDKTTSER